MCVVNCFYLAMRTLGIASFSQKAETDRITLEMFSREAYVMYLYLASVHDPVTSLHNGDNHAHTFYKFIDINLANFTKHICFAVSLLEQQVRNIFICIVGKLVS